MNWTHQIKSIALIAQSHLTMKLKDVFIDGNSKDDKKKKWIHLMLNIWKEEVIKNQD